MQADLQQASLPPTVPRMSVESCLKNPRSGCSLMVLAFGIASGAGIAALGIFLLSMAPGAWREMQEVWTECHGTINATGVKARQVRTGSQPQDYHYSTRHTVVLDCRYQVDGKDYSASALVAPRQAKNESDAEEARSVATSYHVGDGISVYHHPVEHDRARLEPNAPNGLFMMSVIFGPVAILAGIGLGWWVVAEWRGKRRTEG